MAPEMMAQSRARIGKIRFLDMFRSLWHTCAALKAAITDDGGHKRLPYIKAGRLKEPPVGRIRYLATTGIVPAIQRIARASKFEES